MLAYCALHSSWCNNITLCFIQAFFKLHNRFQQSHWDPFTILFHATNKLYITVSMTEHLIPAGFSIMKGSLLLHGGIIYTTLMTRCECTITVYHWVAHHQAFSVFKHLHSPVTRISQWISSYRSSSTLLSMAPDPGEAINCCWCLCNWPWSLVTLSSNKLRRNNEQTWLQLNSHWKIIVTIH